SRARVIALLYFYRRFLGGFFTPPLSWLFVLIGGLLAVVWTDNEVTGLQVLLEQIRAATLRTFLRDGQVLGCKFAFRVIGTSIKSCVVPARPLFHQLAIGALRTLHADI